MKYYLFFDGYSLVAQLPITNEISANWLFLVSVSIDVLSSSNGLFTTNEIADKYKLDNFIYSIVSFNLSKLTDDQFISLLDSKLESEEDNGEYSNSPETVVKDQNWRLVIRRIQT